MQWSMSGDWIHGALGAWLATLFARSGAAPAGDVAVVFGLPGPDGGPASADGAARTAPQGINLHLLSIAPHAQATTRTARRTESQLVLRYLATCWAAHPDNAEALLCTLAFHLLERGAGGPDGHSEIVVEPVPPALDVLAALGLRPRPALVFTIPLVHVDEPEPARRVEHPPIVRAEPRDGRLRLQMSFEQEG